MKKILYLGALVLALTCCTNNNKKDDNTQNVAEKTEEMKFLSIDDSKIKDSAFIFKALTPEDKEIISEAMKRLVITLDSTKSLTMKAKNGAEVNISENLYNVFKKIIATQSTELEKSKKEIINLLYGISKTLEKGEKEACDFLHEKYPGYDSVVVRTSKSSNVTEYTVHWHDKSNKSHEQSILNHTALNSKEPTDLTVTHVIK